jgi:branched-chain amino acid transport system permease protein
MSDFVFALILGVGVGGLYAMLSTGLVTTYKGSGVINFAHGAFAMYTAYTYDEVNTAGQFQLPWVDILPTHGLNVPVTISVGGPQGAFVSTLIALSMAAFLGLLAHLLVFRPLRNAPALGKVIGSVGVMLYLQTIADLHFGNSSRQNPGFLPGTTGDRTFVGNFLGLGNMPKNYLWFAGCAIVMGASVWALLKFTRFGLSTRACDENEKGASLLGYSPQWVAGLNWVLSAVLAGITGIVVIGLGALQISQFSLYVVPALAAALVGNLQSIPLAVAGGFATGMLQSGIVHLAEQSWWPSFLPSTGIRTFIPLLIVVIVLYVKGDSLPVRGSIIERRQPLSLEAQKPWVGVVVGAIMIAGLSAALTGKWEVALTTTIVTAMVMLSWVVIVGFVGQISLAQTAIAGVAAFTAIRLASSGKLVPGVITPVEGPGWPSPLAFLIGVAAAVLVGLLLGLPALRIRGVQLAIVSIAAVGPINDLILLNKSVMSEAATTAMAVPRPKWFGLDVGARDPVTNLDDYWHFTAFAGVWLILIGLAVANLRRGAAGRRFLAVRANERAASAVGIDVARSKLLGFMIASAIAGIAGVLQAYRLGSVQATSYSLFIGLGILAMAYIGGITSVWGAVIGGLLVSGGLVSQILSDLSGSDFRTYMSLIGAIGLILTAILNPEGIATGNALLIKGLWAKLRHSDGAPSAPDATPVATSPAEPVAAAEGAS